MRAHWDGRVVVRRVHDRDRSQIVRRAFALVEAGATFGDVSRRFNSEGLRTRRGKRWTTRAVREIVTSAY